MTEGWTDVWMAPSSFSARKNYCKVKFILEKLFFVCKCAERRFKLLQSAKKYDFLYPVFSTSVGKINSHKKV